MHSKAEYRVTTLHGIKQVAITGLQVNFIRDRDAGGEKEMNFEMKRQTLHPHKLE